MTENYRAKFWRRKLTSVRKNNEKNLSLKAYTLCEIIKGKQGELFTSYGQLFSII